MRRTTILFAFALAACDPGERAVEVGSVQQATVDDGKADGVFGQPDFTTGTPPPSVSQMSASAPVAIGTTSSSGDTSILWVPDREAHRVVGFTPGDSPIPIYLAGQNNWFSGERNAGGAVGPLTLNAPTAAAQAFGQLAIADTGNHRVLFGYVGGFPFVPNAVFGQHGSYVGDSPNSGGISAETLSLPSGLAFDASFSPGRLIISDSGNHRVLVFALASPLTSTAAIGCLGQPDCKSALPNRGGAPSAQGLSEPRGIANWFDPKDTKDPWRGYYVADSANHRVLHYKVFDTAADFVYGQGGDFATAVPSKGGPSASSLRNPTAVAVDRDGSLWVADTGHHRVLHFPKGKNVADRVLGQPDFTTVSAPTVVTASAMRAPEGVAITSNGSLWVADTGHHRVLRFHRPCTAADCDDGNPCTDDRCDAVTGCAHDFRTFSRECSPYRCDFGTQKCQQPCTTSAPCLSPYTCQSGRCVLRCATDGQCVSSGRTCVDGFCCDRACEGPCESCSVSGIEGTCSTVAAGPLPTNRTCEIEPGECGARCNGFDAKRCSTATLGTPCGVEACTDGVAKTGGTCDGAGLCRSRDRRCAPYACAANGCQDSCFGDHQCAPNARCVGGECIDSPPHVSGGCAIRPIGSPDETFGALVALAGLALLRRRRR